LNDAARSYRQHCGAMYKRPMQHNNVYNSGVTLGDAHNQSHLRQPVAKDPLKHGTKAEKIAFCQRQIDRYVRWKIADPSSIEFTKALNAWTKMKNFAMEGRI
jgi:hypothetical protein